MLLFSTKTKFIFLFTRQKNPVFYQIFVSALHSAQRMVQSYAKCRLVIYCASSGRIHSPSLGFTHASATKRMKIVNTSL